MYSRPSLHDAFGTSTSLQAQPSRGREKSDGARPNGGGGGAGGGFGARASAVLTARGEGGPFGGEAVGLADLLQLLRGHMRDEVDGDARRRVGPAGLLVLQVEGGRRQVDPVGVDERLGGGDHGA